MLDQFEILKQDNVDWFDAKFRQPVLSFAHSFGRSEQRFPNLTVAPFPYPPATPRANVALSRQVLTPNKERIVY